MIDMGGASAQIAFELPIESDFTSENVQFINLGRSENDHRYLYKLFVTTFLGFGVNEGAKKYEEILLKKMRETNRSDLHNNSTNVMRYIPDGCLPVDFLKLIHLNNGSQFVRRVGGFVFYIHPRVFQI